MHVENQICRIFWEKTEYQSARILRVFSKLPVLKLPDQIAGYPVTELGSYCFAPDCHLPDTFLTTDTDDMHMVLTDFCGSYPQMIYLPDTLQKIGNYAFYNCRHLYGLWFSDSLRSVGSDVFMNCNHLHQISLTCNPDESSGLRQILAQISWDVEVSFFGRNYMQNTEPKAVIFYPEFYEAYDEIAPAHIFGRKIIGEGFRCRQCFSEGIIDFAQYDQIFSKACIDESEQTLCHMAFCRIRYPYHLVSSVKKQYADYILSYSKPLCEQLVKERRLQDLAALFQEKLLTSQMVRYVLFLAAQTGWSEGNASMLRWNQALNQSEKQNRYDFDDFI